MPASDSDAPDPSEVFGALADPTRRRLLDQLSSEGPLTASELATSYPVSRQAVAKHLSMLSSAGLLHQERRGREVRYSVDASRLAGASAWLDQVGRRWDSRLDALKRHLGSERGR